MSKLNQGYSYVENAAGKAVKSIAQVKEDEELAIQMTDGKVIARVKEKEPRPVWEEEKALG